MKKIVLFLFCISTIAVNANDLGNAKNNSTAPDQREKSYEAPEDECPIDFGLVETDNPDGCSDSETGSICVTVVGTHGTEFELSLDNGVTWDYFGDGYLCVEDMNSGEYNLVIRDQGHCEVVYEDNPVVLGVDDQIYIIAFETTPETHASLGSIAVIPVGLDPFQYRIDGGAWQSDSIFTDLPFGTYDVDVKDRNGCIASEEATVDDERCPEFTVERVNETNCNSSNGELAFTVTVGIRPCLFSIDNAATWQSDSVFTGLSAGGYDVAVKSDNGCISYGTKSISQAYAKFSSASSSTDPSCIGSEDGDIASHLYAGQLPYTYSIDNGVTWQSNGNFSDLPAGEYSVIGMDTYTCTDTMDFLLSNPDHDTVSYVSVLDILGCAGDETGIIVINGDLPEQTRLKSVNGTSPDQYSINNGAEWQSENLFEGLAAGEYTVVVDVGGCQYPYYANPLEITEPDTVKITSVLITPDTGESSGGLEITASGGFNKYYYSIDEGEHFYTESTFTGLDAGEYHIVVNDSVGCETDSVVTVPDESITISDVETTDVAVCYGDETGAITITASGGGTVLSYSIDDGVTWQSSDEFTELAAGDYNIQVKDDNGTVETWGGNPVTISEPAEISSMLGFKNPLCAGESSGWIKFIITSGGQRPYTWSCDNGVTYGSDSLFENLPAGFYNLFIKDANGCEKAYRSNPRELSDPDPFEIFNVEATDNNHCSGDGNGSISILLEDEESMSLKSTEASSPDYYYSIDDGATWHEDTSLFENLSSGSYNVWAMNENDCTDEWDANPVVIEDVNTLEVDTFRVADDDGTGIGEIEVLVIGGTTPYEYRLDDGAWQSSQLFESLFAGTYLLEVLDSTGCEQSESITVDDASVPEYDTIAGTTFESDDDLCFGATLTITISGDAEEDSVDFEAGSSTTLIAGESITFLPGTHIHSGSYLWAFITTDGSFCDVYAPSLVETVTMPVKGVKEQTVYEQQRAVAGVVDKKGGGYALKVFPNPNNGRFSIELSGFDKPAELVIYNSLGAVVKRLPVIPGNTTPVQLTLRQGIYYVKALSKEKSLYQKISIK